MKDFTFNVFLILVLIWCGFCVYSIHQKFVDQVVEKPAVKAPIEVSKGYTVSWDTANVTGEVECLHAWGRTAITKPVKMSLTKWRADGVDTLYVNIEAEQPIIEGKQQTGYMGPMVKGVYNNKFPEYLQDITEKSVICVGENENIHIIKSAIISFKNNKPEHILFIQGEQAMFDVPEFIEKIKKAGGFLADRQIEYLQGFNKQGYRIRTVEAVFK